MRTSQHKTQPSIKKPDDKNQNDLQMEISSLKAQLQNLEAEHLMFQGLLETIPDNIYFKDRQSRFTRMSNAMDQWFKNKIDIDEVLGKTDFDMFTSEHAQEAFDDEQRIMETGEPLKNKEEKETWEDGSITWVSTSKVPLYDRDKNIIGIVGISRDITERKENEAKLRQYRENLEAAKQETDNILSNVDEGLFLIDQELNLSSQYSKELEAILIEEHLSGRNFLDILKEKISDEEIDSVRRYLELLFDDSNDAVMLSDLNPLIKVPMIIEGLEKYLTFKFKRIKNDGEHTTQLIATVNDVTKEVLLSKSLEESRAENKRKMDWMLCLLNIDPTMLKEFVHSARQELDSALDAVEKLYKTPEKLDLMELIYRSVHTIKGNASLLELDFFARRAHETEDILSGMRDSKLTRKTITACKEEISSLEKMYEELRDLIGQFSKIHEQFRPRRNHEYNMLINSLVKLADRLTHDNGKEVHVDFSAFEAADIPFQHKLMIRDVLVQLIRNSITHGIESLEERKIKGKPEEGTIQIIADKKDDGFEIKFIDDGRGIDRNALKEKALASGNWTKEQLANFDENQLNRLIFASGISTEKKASMAAGRGVGMDIILKKVQKAGGSIEVESKEGQSTTFIIVLPLKNEH